MNNTGFNRKELLQNILENSPDNVTAIWTNLENKVLVKMVTPSLEDLGDVVTELVNIFNLDINTIQGAPVVNDNRINKQEGYYVRRD